MTEFLIRRFIRAPQDTRTPAARGRYGVLAGVVGLLCNLLLCGGKFLAGFLFGSVSIMADAVNNLSDASSCLITLLGFKLGGKPADAEHPFGHARIEYLSGLSVAVLIMAIGVDLLRTGFERTLQPEPVTFSLLSVTVLTISILVKLWMAAFYRSIGRRIGSTALEATGADSRNDVISTGGVLVAAVAARMTGLSLDGPVAMAVALFILWGGVGVVRETLNPLLGEAPSEELVDTLSRRIMGYDGVLGLHDLMVHDYGPGRRFASVHVEMSASEQLMHSHDVIDNIERDILEQEGIHLVIHLDPISDDDEEISAHREMAAELVREIDPRLTIHDFRMVKGDDHTNLIFDVVMPPDFSMKPDQLKRTIGERMREQDPNHFAVVTVDYSYTTHPAARKTDQRT